MQCPNPTCGSTDVRSNHIRQSWIDGTFRVAQAARVKGSPKLALVTGTVGGGMKLFNHLRKAWRCNACRAVFD